VCLQKCKKQLLAASCVSTFQHETTELPLDMISLNLIFQYFLKMHGDSSRFIKIRQEQQVLYMKMNIHFFIISHSFLLRMKNVSDKSCKGNPNSHFILNNFSFNVTIYEILWKNIVHPSRPQMIWHKNFACCVPKATALHSEYVVLIAFPLQQWKYEHASLFCYT